MAGSREKSPEFQSPRKSIHSFLRPRGSLDSIHTANEITSVHSSSSGRNSPVKSPSKAFISSLIPRFSPSRSSMGSARQSPSEEQEPKPETTILNFADTDSSYDSASSEAYAESVESILQEYRDPVEEKFVFEEHFDSTSKVSRQSSVRQATSRNVSKSIIEQTVNESSLSVATDFFDARDQSRSGSNTGSNSGSGSGSSRASRPQRSSTASIGTRNSKRFTIHSDSGEPQANTREAKVLSTSSNIDVLNRSSLFNLTSVSDLHPEPNRTINETSEHPLVERNNNTTISNEQAIRDSINSLSTNELLDKLTSPKIEQEQADESYYNQENVSDLPVMVYEVKPFKQESQPRLVRIQAPTSPVPVHFQHSDIGPQNAVKSVDIIPPDIKHTTEHSKHRSMGSPRRPPPKAPTKDTLSAKNSHESLIPPKKNVEGIPQNFSQSNLLLDDTSSYSFNDSEEKFQDQQTITDYSWKFYICLMILGLLLPPIYFLVPMGVFDRVTTGNKKRLFGYHQHMYRPNIVRFSRIQKTISVLLGLFWFAVIITMIGVGFGVRR